MAALTNLGMRIQETISESTRDFSFIARSQNSEFFDGGEDKVKKISGQLESSSERDKLDGMKRLIAVRHFVVLFSQKLHVFGDTLH